MFDPTMPHGIIRHGETQSDPQSTLPRFVRNGCLFRADGSYHSYDRQMENVGSSTTPNNQSAERKQRRRPVHAHALRRRATSSTIARLFYDLDPLIAENRPAPPSIGKVLLYCLFDSAEKVERNILPRRSRAKLRRYFAQALRRAVTSGDLDKELGIKRPRAGNPGGTPRKRVLSPDDHTEIALRVCAELKAPKAFLELKKLRRQIFRQLANEYEGHGAHRLRYREDL